MAVEPHGRILAYPIVSKLDAGAPHRHVQLLPAAFLPLILEGDGEKVPLEIKVETDPQESLTQGDEGRHVLDSIGIEVLQLDLVVVQQPPKKFVGGGREPTLMKVGERNHIAIGQ